MPCGFEEIASVALRHTSSHKRGGSKVGLLYHYYFRTSSLPSFSFGSEKEAIPTSLAKELMFLKIFTWRTRLLSPHTHTQPQLSCIQIEMNAEIQGLVWLGLKSTILSISNTQCPFLPSFVCMLLCSLQILEGSMLPVHGMWRSLASPPTPTKATASRHPVAFTSSMFSFALPSLACLQWYPQPCGLQVQHWSATHSIIPQLKAFKIRMPLFPFE